MDSSRAFVPIAVGASNVEVEQNDDDTARVEAGEIPSPDVLGAIGSIVIEIVKLLIPGV
jgi:hypothetical protein